MKDGFSAEKSSANCAELKRMQAGEVSYQENSAAAATHARLEIDGVSAEKSHLLAKVGRTIKTVSRRRFFFYYSICCNELEE